MKTDLDKLTQYRPGVGSSLVRTRVCLSLALRKKKKPQDASGSFFKNYFKSFNYLISNTCIKIDVLKEHR
jgi:hypothetical protein